MPYKTLFCLQGNIVSCGMTMQELFLNSHCSSARWIANEASKHRVGYLTSKKNNTDKLIDFLISILRERPEDDAMATVSRAWYTGGIINNYSTNARWI